MTDRRLRWAYAEGCRALDQREFARALATFGQALATNPECPLNLHGAGIALTKLSHFEEAESLFRRAIESAETSLGGQNPTVATVALGLIDLYQLEERFEDSERVCRHVLRGMKGAPPAAMRARILLRLAELCRRQGRLKDAERAYLAAIAERGATFGSRHPKVAEIMPHLAELYREMDRPTDAAEVLQRTLGKGCQEGAAGDSLPPDGGEPRPQP